MILFYATECGAVLIYMQQNLKLLTIAVACHIFVCAFRHSLE